LPILGEQHLYPACSCSQQAMRQMTFIAVIPVENVTLCGRGEFWEIWRDGWGAAIYAQSKGHRPSAVITDGQCDATRLRRL
ncbi:hypothetical protein N5J76_21350, partial [Pseudomonas sp. GD03855]|nr:hypothetical protein [Pseudomonas sp. GD03856]MDH2267445.1 hypothetical protein [Pseudomonas sp. GD03855]